MDCIFMCVETYWLCSSRDGGPILLVFQEDSTAHFSWLTPPLWIPSRHLWFDHIPPSSNSVTFTQCRAQRARINESKYIHSECILCRQSMRLVCREISAGKSSLFLKHPSSLHSHKCGCFPSVWADEWHIDACVWYGHKRWWGGLNLQLVSRPRWARCHAQN